MSEPEVKNETTDASLPAIGWTVVIVSAGLILALGVGLLFWSGRPELRRSAAVEGFKHGPSDRPAVLGEWPSIDAANREHLTTYGWVDRSAGVVRIPIDQAMKRLAP